jgi:hypothetical protein
VSKLHQDRVVLRWAIFGLTITAAAVHLVIGMQAQAAAETGRSLLLILNGLGYFALLTAIALGELKKIRRQIFLYYVLGAYTLITFTLHFVFDGITRIDAAAIVSKCAELLAIGATALYIFAPKDRANEKPRKKQPGA